MFLVLPGGNSILLGKIGICKKRKVQLMDEKDALRVLLNMTAIEIRTCMATSGEPFILKNLYKEHLKEVVREIWPKVYGMRMTVVDEITFFGRENKENQECIWSEQNFGDFWEMACGDAFCFTDGGPKENNMKFCANCGKYLIEKKQEREMDE